MEAQVQLSRQEGGVPLRKHLQAAAARGMPADPRLLATPPAAASLLWDAFVDLMPDVRASEISAWQQLNGVRLSPWEVDTLHEMRRAAEAASEKQASTPTPGDPA